MQTIGTDTTAYSLLSHASPKISKRISCFVWWLLLAFPVSVSLSMLLPLPIDPSVSTTGAVRYRRWDLMPCIWSPLTYLCASFPAVPLFRTVILSPIVSAEPLPTITMCYSACSSFRFPHWLNNRVADTSFYLFIYLFLIIACDASSWTVGLEFSFREDRSRFISIRIARRALSNASSTVLFAAVVKYVNLDTTEELMPFGFPQMNRSDQKSVMLFTIRLLSLCLQCSGLWISLAVAFNSFLRLFFHSGRKSRLSDCTLLKNVLISFFLSSILAETWFNYSKTSTLLAAHLGLWLCNFSSFSFWSEIVSYSNAANTLPSCFISCIPKWETKENFDVIFFPSFLHEKSVVISLKFLAML